MKKTKIHKSFLYSIRYGVANRKAGVECRLDKGQSMSRLHICNIKMQNIFCILAIYGLLGSNFLEEKHFQAKITKREKTNENETTPVPPVRRRRRLPICIPFATRAAQ
ncbi:MAG: hypothetical protein IKP58_15240 [Victivallales bacterium]|nr:hypothetical protein [Victivallales bacterium]